MTISEIRQLPQSVDKLPEGVDKTRASEVNFRGFQMLQKAQQFLEQGTPAEVVAEIIADVMDN